jgi:hypothetical protein
MDFLKQWTFSVCITLIISVIFSLIAPKGRLSGFYKIIISLFIFISFLYPFTQFDIKGIDLSEYSFEYEMNNNSNSVYENMINEQVKAVLIENDVNGADVTSEVKIDNDEIMVNSVLVAVSDDYDIAYVEKLLFDNLSINAKVIHIGQ